MKITNQSYWHPFRTGYASSILLFVSTLVTFGFAITAIPIAGPFCPEGCIEYPYLDSLHTFPKDYIWMYLAMIMLIIYTIFVSILTALSDEGNRITSLIALIFSLMAVPILLVDYYIQSWVVPASLMFNETEGLPLLIQYNGHGIFIALEELAYLLMSISFLFLAPLFKGEGRPGTILSWILRMALPLSILSFLMIISRFGLARSYRFEVYVISINWLTLLFCGVLAAVWYRRRLKSL